MHGEMRNAYKIFAGKPEGKWSHEDLRGIILKCIFGKYFWDVWFELILIRIETLVLKNTFGFRKDWGISWIAKRTIVFPGWTLLRGLGLRREIVSNGRLSCIMRHVVATLQAKSKRPQIDVSVAFHTSIKQTSHVLNEAILHVTSE